MDKHEAFQAKAGIEPVDTGIAEAGRKTVADALCRVVADTYTLYVKTQGFHWNVVGPLFFSLHELTEQQYKDLAESIDEMAERVRALGFPAPGSFTEFTELRTLSDVDGLPSGQEMIEHLIADHEAVSREVRKMIEAAEEVEDGATADLGNKRLAEHEKAVWMLRALIA